MAGFIPREKLFKYYQLADVCCIPLLYGNMSIAILEAIAHGLPIVTTAHSGISEIEKVGIKVPAKDSEATADAIITLLSNPKLLRIKSANARNLIRNYYWNGIAKKFVDVYENFKN
jgi:glycosyltransferase involved in cell wall biosynthesis